MLLPKHHQNYPNLIIIDIDFCICLAFRRVVIVLIMYCTPSIMWGYVTSSANGRQYITKINKYFLLTLLKRGDWTLFCDNDMFISPSSHFSCCLCISFTQIQFQFVVGRSQILFVIGFIITISC